MKKTPSAVASTMSAGVPHSVEAELAHAVEADVTPVRMETPPWCQISPAPWL